MSLQNLKPTRNGYYFSSAQKKAIILLYKVLMKEGKNAITLAHLKSLSQKFFVIMEHTVNRFILLFQKDAQTHPYLYLHVYLSAKQESLLDKKAEMIEKDLNAFFQELSLNLKKISGKKAYQELTPYFPQSIKSTSSKIFHIKTASKKRYFITALMISLPAPSLLDDFYCLLNDFLSTIASGVLSIDVLLEKKEKMISNGKDTAIKIILLNEDQSLLLKDFEKLIFLLRRLGSNTRLKTEKIATFLTEKELRSNFGRLLLHQSWHHFTSQKEDIIDFSRLLPIIRDYFLL